MAIFFIVDMAVVVVVVVVAVVVAVVVVVAVAVKVIAIVVAVAVVVVIDVVVTERQVWDPDEQRAGRRWGPHTGGRGGITWGVSFEFFESFFINLLTQYPLGKFRVFSKITHHFDQNLLTG